MAQQLINSLSADFDPGRFKDEYRERVLELIERKAAGEQVAVTPEAEETEPAPDLMAALEASLAEVRSGSSDAPAPKGAGGAKGASRSKSKSSRSSGGKDGAKSDGAKSGGRSRAKAG